MSPQCNVCSESLSEPIYESREERSVTTMNTLVPGRTRVFLCATCLHLQTNELPNLEAYYSHDYEINLSSEDEDQIYDVVDGKPIFRADHQAAVLSSKVELFDGCRVLDYGCAKAPTLRKLCGKHPQIQPLLFDVTDKYIPFWERYPTQAQWATHQPDPSWNGTVDVVLSFYALEHVADLHEAMRNVSQLLRPGGLFYFIVPNAYQNIADFVVADHINHFSPSSLTHLLGQAGFSDVDVDEAVHHAAFVVTGRWTGERSVHSPAREERSARREAAETMAEYWSGIRGRITDFVDSLDSSDVPAIYGAGFYGNFIASVLGSTDRIRCFFDQNPHLHGTEIHGKPVLGPADLPADVSHVLVGLNPRNAERNIASIEAWQGKDLSFLFL